MANPYTKENPGNFANNRKRASEAGHKGGETTAGRYLEEARAKNARHSGRKESGSRGKGRR